jgi:flagellar hook-basal body complex protein FliE
MLHLIRFAAGVATGIVAIKLLQSKSTRKTLDKAGQSTKETLEKASQSTKETLEKAQDKLRDVTVSSLEAIESASAKARAKLTSEDGESKDAPKKVKSRKHSKHEKIQSDQE